MLQDKIMIDDVEVAYKITGNGKPVFCIHGWGGTKESFDDLSKEFPIDEFMFISCDLPGFGGTPEPKSPWRVIDYAQFFCKFVQDICKKYSLKSYCVMVHSFGGRVILKTFDEGLIRPDVLVIIAGAGLRHKPGLKRKFGKAISSISHKLFAVSMLSKFTPFARKVFYKIFRVHDLQNCSPIMMEIFKRVVDEDLTSALSSIRVPTLILWGDKDSYVPVEDAFQMHEKIPGSEVKIFAGGKHGIHHTHAAQLAPYIKQFILTHYER